MLDLTCMATCPMAWNAEHRIVSERVRPVRAGELTGSAVAILLQLTEQEKHRLVEVVRCEFDVVVGCESGDELNDGTSNERVAMVLVLKDLVADFDEPLAHELVSIVLALQSSVRMRRTHHLPFEE